MKKGLIIIVLGLLVNTAFSQKSPTRKADEAYEIGEYFKAIELYKEAYKKTSDKKLKAQIVFNTAECYRFINNSKKAESYYKKAIAKKYSEPIMYLRYAEMMKKNKKYEEAVPQFEEYTKLVPDDPRGEVGMESCKLSAEWLANPTRYQIENIRDINTKAPEFSPQYSNKNYTEVYFTSARKGKNLTKVNPITGDYYTDIFETEINKIGEWSEPVALSDTINSGFDEGSVTLVKDGTTMYITRCVIIKHKDIGCQIYEATRKAGEYWSSTQLIEIAGDSVSSGHPSISHDGETLYFVSSMPGGQGGTDIWVMVKEDGNWGKPENLSKEINTPGNEMYPYIREDGTLYFCSDSHLGMGGLDIFKAVKDENDKWVIENMKYPINSAEDDFGIVFKGKKEEGLLTSTRKGGRGGDDIYSFVLPPLSFSLGGIVKDAYNDEPIVDAKIKIIGSDGTLIIINSKEDGKFRYMLKPSTDYVYSVSKDGYLRGKGKASTTVLKDSKDFMSEIVLAPLAQTIDLPNIYYDSGKANLRTESEKELDLMIKRLKDNPNITIEIGSHTDMIGDNKSNMKLSQERAQSVVNYLIEKGIPADRLTAKGQGESMPKEITKKLAESTIFDEGTVLNKVFIDALDTEEEKEAAHQINRRTDFRVLTTDYMPKL